MSDIMVNIFFVAHGTADQILWLFLEGHFFGGWTPFQGTVILYAINLKNVQNQKISWVAKKKLKIGQVGPEIW